MHVTFLHPVAGLVAQVDDMSPTEAAPHATHATVLPRCMEAHHQGKTHFVTVKQQHNPVILPFFKSLLLTHRRLQRVPKAGRYIRNVTYTATEIWP